MGRPYRHIPDSIKTKIRRISREENLSNRILSERFGYTDSVIARIVETNKEGTNHDTRDQQPGIYVIQANQTG
jgi:hypothetical protein